MKKLLTLALSCMFLVSTGAFAQKTDTLKKKKKTKTTVEKTETKASPAAAAVTTTETKTTATTKAVVAKTPDKVIGKNAKGSPIYLGPKGGQYTLSPTGKKEYIKTADKMKVN